MSWQADRDGISPRSLGALRLMPDGDTGTSELARRVHLGIRQRVGLAWTVPEPSGLFAEPPCGTHCALGLDGGVTSLLNGFRRRACAFGLRFGAGHAISVRGAVVANNDFATIVPCFAEGSFPWSASKNGLALAPLI